MTITDKDREAAARCACARDREEGRREERKACVQDCLNMAVDGGTSEGDAGYNAAIADCVAAIRAEYEAKLATFGMVELAVRNPNVSSYITEWEGRALSAEAKLASERKHADELYAALDEVMTFTLEDFPDMDARHPKACVTPAYRAANVAGVDVLRAHTARRAKEE